MTLQDQIEAKVAERRECRNDPDLAALIETELSDLYAEMRVERARATSGDRNNIVRRARIERELQKLAES